MKDFIVMEIQLNTNTWSESIYQFLIFYSMKNYRECFGSDD